MYAFIKGLIENIDESGIVIENAGIGYNLLMPMSKAFAIGNVGDEVKVYTYTHVREDAIILYGFPNREELSFFKLLISVSGVGPKSAQDILGSFSVDELIRAIASEDAKLLAKAQGVGKKTADRIIVDLKDKVSKFSSSDIDISLKNNESNDIAIIDECCQALQALGYGAKESREAVKKAYNDSITDVETLLRGAIKNL